MIPAFTGEHAVNDAERKLISLPSKLGGLGIKDVGSIATMEYENSRKMTKNLVNTIIKNDDQNEDEQRTKYQIKAEREENNKKLLEDCRKEMSEMEKRQNDANQESGASTWLTTLSIKDQGYNLTKVQFRDALRIRYN